MKCTICKKDIYIQSSDDEPKRICDQPVCEDCYFNEIGKIIEKHPIGFKFYKQGDHISCNNCYDIYCAYASDITCGDWKPLKSLNHD